MFHLVTPFLISLIILDRRISRKIVYTCALFPIGLGVIISQTRGTWISLAIGILIAIFLSYFAKTRNQRGLHSLILPILMLVMISLLSLTFIGRSSTTKEEFTSERVETIGNLGKDPSLIMRAGAYLTIIHKIMQRPLLGHGLGDTATYNFFNTYSKQTNVDSTYLTILWKMGIIGIVPFLILYFLLLKRSYYIYRYSDVFFMKIFSIGILSAFTAFLILGIISPILITSRFNFLFGVLFAITDIFSSKRNLMN
jgi:O-antigen ligase